MAVRKIGIVFIIAYFLFEMVEAKLFCQPDDEDGEETMDCGNNETHIITLRKDMLPVSNKVNSISLSDCEIGKCDVDVFENLPLLRIIDLSSNYLDNITVGTFDCVPALEELDLSYNRINYLSVDLFKTNHNLRRMNLKGNSLHWFETGVFDSLVNLTKLVLSLNNIQGQHLQSELFYHNVEINLLRFSGNNMTDTPFDLLSKLNNLSKLELDKCSLKDFPSFLKPMNLKNLNGLSLNNNELTRIDNGVFDHLVNLVVLNLSFNKIQYIAENSFRNLSHLKLLYLDGNLLVTIPQVLFKGLPQLNILNLSRNMIRALPDDLLKRNNVKYLNVSYNRLTYLQTDFCSQQKLGVFKFFAFDYNPWQCACLKELLSEVKNLKIIYNTAYFDGGRPVCATTSEFICKRADSLNEFYVDLFNRTVV